MNTKEILDPEWWAKSTFGASKRKDIRRTGRAVKTAAHMAENASASLPAQMQTWKETMALYRLLNEEDVTEDRTDAAALATDARTDRNPIGGPAGARHHRGGSHPSSENHGSGPGWQ
jgi:Transposase DNA-binding